MNSPKDRLNIWDHDPGTPDDDVLEFRREGRQGYRSGKGRPPKGHKHQIQWWLGWYDERLRRFYGR